MATYTVFFPGLTLNFLGVELVETLSFALLPSTVHDISGAGFESSAVQRKVATSSALADGGPSRDTRAGGSGRGGGFIAYWGGGASVIPGRAVLLGGGGARRFSEMG